MAHASLEHEQLVRRDAFEYLSQLSLECDEILPWARLVRGFEFRGQRVPLVSQNGIFKPRILAYPISLRTTPPKFGWPRPYDDQFDEEGMLHYAFRDTSKPQARADNARLSEAAELGLPLIYFHGVFKGQYLAAWPVFVERIDTVREVFLVRCDQPLPAISVESGPSASLLREEGSQAEYRRRYVTTEVLRRMHQQSFRHRVLRAYRKHCAVCRLRHSELLDAAHILPDSEGGEAVVPNGISLCKLHHAALDHEVLGLRPDYIIEIRSDILEEIDGPMLEHGQQKLHGLRLHLPHRSAEHPNPEWLEERYARFRMAL
ncbi:MAG: HNH endonuclease [Planctomycetota bacterium]